MSEGALRDVAIPDIGDAENVEVIEICVAVADAVAENDALLVIESEKASMEVPAPFAGTVAAIVVALGDEVNSGDVIMRLAEAQPSAAGGAGEDEADKSDDGGAQAAAETSAPADGAAPTASSDNAPDGPPGADGAPATGRAPPVPAAASPATAPSRGASIYAGPAVRRLARELGVDLAGVVGSGAAGRILKEDVKGFVKDALLAPSAVAGATPVAPAADIDFSRFGDVEEVPLSRVRARGAANLARSWREVVHVTQHDDADVTDLEAFRASLGDAAARREVKLTPLPLVLKACVHVLQAHPQFNASLNAAVSALIHKRYYNIGIAVDTADGLVVPVLRGADALGVLDLAAEIERLSAAARARRLKPDEMQGGSFTVSSLGALGGTGFTPVVNAPEVAILGLGRLDTRPVWNGIAFAPRRVLPLSLSYDHRAINGAEAGRFLAELKAVLGDLRLALV